MAHFRSQDFPLKTGNTNLGLNQKLIYQSQKLLEKNPNHQNPDAYKEAGGNHSLCQNLDNRSCLRSYQQLWIWQLTISISSATLTVLQEQATPREFNHFNPQKLPYAPALHAQQQFTGLKLVHSPFKLCFTITVFIVKTNIWPPFHTGQHCDDLPVLLTGEAQPKLCHCQQGCGTRARLGGRCWTVPTVKGSRAVPSPPLHKCHPGELCLWPHYLPPSL